MDETGYSILRQNLLTLRARFPDCENQTNKWGFVIVRCTYSSQTKRDRFLSRIHEDVRQSLLGYKGEEPDVNADLQASFDCPVIEDEALLENATWRTARAKFEEWLRENLLLALKHTRVRRNQTRTQIQSRITPALSDIRVTIPFAALKYHSPRWCLCIFVDKAAVDSVVDCGETDESKEESGKYFVTLVATSPDSGDEECDSFNVNGERHDCEKDRECVKGLYRRVKAHRLVEFYEQVANGFWDDDLFYMEDDEGVLLVH